MRHLAAALFACIIFALESAPAHAQTTALFLDGEPGHYVFEGTRSIAPSDATFVASRNFRGGVTIRVTPAASSMPTTVEFSAPHGEPLQTGEYPLARPYLSTEFAGLALSHDGRSCAEVTGRFIVLEVGYGPTGEVLRFSADFEAHCSSSDPALRGAVRYNAVDSPLEPFGGAYPDYRVTVSVGVGGRVTGPFDCDGGLTCEASFTSPTTISMEAWPDAGYLFAGWSGECSGGSSIVVRVRSVTRCSADFQLEHPEEPRTVMAVYSEAGDSVGQGVNEIFSQGNSRWSVSPIEGRRGVAIEIRAVGAVRDRRWSIAVTAPSGFILRAGESYQAVRYPFALALPGLAVSSDSRGCNRLTGRFYLHEIVYGANGEISSLALDVEQHCEDLTPALFVAVRYGSSAAGLEPFPADTSRYRLAIVPSATGRVFNDLLDCGSGGDLCAMDISEAAEVTLTAEPDPGHIFVGWTGACQGGEGTRVNLNSVRTCEATFEPSIPSTPRTLLRLSGPPGDPLTQGRSRVFSLANSRWSDIAQGQSRIEFTVRGLGERGETTWQFAFWAPEGQNLLRNHRYIMPAGAHPSAAGFSVTGEARGCTGTGSFIIRSLEYLTFGGVLRAAVEFEHACVGSGTAALTGTLQYWDTHEVRQFRLDPAVANLYFAATVRDGQLIFKTPNQLVRLVHSHGDPVPWRIEAPEWVTVSPASGVGSAVLSIGVVPRATYARPGLHESAAISIIVDGTPTLTPRVSLRWHDAEQSSGPRGQVETPLDSAAASGSIGVTGWAIDEIGVRAIRILRSPTNGESGLIHIGEATRVPGARVDIALTYPTSPGVYYAGWGYLLLTNMLPNGGNGTFTLHAYADDVEGNTTLLGSRTITVNNASAIKPFGAIDTPTQGERVSGLVNNFGWVMGHGGRHANPLGGGTVTVFLDGAPVGSPVGWTSRSDVSSLFGAHAGVEHALGVFSLDTTAFPNGVRTLSWSVTDSEGNTDGIGSRYITIDNPVAAASSTAPAAQRLGQPLTASLASTAPLLARRGFDLTTPLRPLHTGVLEGEELDRFEVRAPGATAAWQIADGERRPLPIGARFDPADGTFTWAPGVGFVGPYDFRLGAHDVRIVLHPRGSRSHGPQVMIDTPGPDSVVSGFSRPLTIAGWALDLDDGIDTGVATVHVWAYPVDPLTGERLQPVFLGAAAYGGLRPDVAATFGERYRRSGYSLTVDHLDPGTYDLAVFAWSTVRREFAPARVVRVRR